MDTISYEKLFEKGREDYRELEEGDTIKPPWPIKGYQHMQNSQSDYYYVWAAGVRYQNAITSSGLRKNVKNVVV